jgi:flagellar assembly protein FliH
MRPADPPSTAPRKFSFDAVFDAEGDVVANTVRRKPFYSIEELDAARKEGVVEGQKIALDRAEKAQAECLEDIRVAVRRSMTVLVEAVHEHRAGAVGLAMAAARKIADAALERFPEAPAEAALQALSREIEAHPRLLVRAPADVADRIQAALDKTAEAAGYPGQVVVKSDPNLQGAAFIFEWGEGRAAFDPEQAAARVAAALDATLAAEGLHAEPLKLTEEASDG